MHAQRPESHTHPASHLAKERSARPFGARAKGSTLVYRLRRNGAVDSGRDIYLRIGMEEADLSTMLESRLRHFGLTFIEEGCPHEIYTIVSTESAEWFIQRLQLEQGILSVEPAEPPSCK